MQLSQVTLNGVLMQNEQSWVGKLTTKGTNWFASTTYFVKGELPDKIFMLLHIDEAIIILNQAIEKLPLKLPKKWNPHSVGPPCSTAYVPPEYCFKSINPSQVIWYEPQPKLQQYLATDFRFLRASLQFEPLFNASWGNFTQWEREWTKKVIHQVSRTTPCTLGHFLMMRGNQKFEQSAKPISP